MTYTDDVSAMLAEREPRARLELLTIAGSRAYGTDHAGSDTDLRGMYTLPGEDFLVVSDPMLHYETEEPDVSVKELKEFLRMMAKGNPHSLESLWVEPEDIIHTGPIALIILAERDKFLTQSAVKSYYGYLTGQVNYANRMGSDHRRYSKTLGHVSRIWAAFTHLIDNREILVRLTPEDVATCQSVGACTPEEFAHWSEIVLGLADRIMDTHLACFPEQVDPDWLDSFAKILRYLRESS